MILAILSALALLDAGFAGFRDAAGRDPRLHKWRCGYFPRAIVRGLVVGVVAQLVVALLVAVPLLWLDLMPDYRRAADAMVTIYAPFAIGACLAFVPYLVPSVDVRSLVTVLVLGPVTMARPLVMLAGAIVAMVAVPRPGPCLAIAVAVGATLLVEPALGALRQRPVK